MWSRASRTQYIHFFRAQVLNLNEIKHFRNIAKTQYAEIKAKEEKQKESSSFLRSVLSLRLKTPHSLLPLPNPISTNARASASAYAVKESAAAVAVPPGCAVTLSVNHLALSKNMDNYQHNLSVSFSKNADKTLCWCQRRHLGGSKTQL